MTKLKLGRDPCGIYTSVNCFDQVIHPLTPSLVQKRALMAFAYNNLVNFPTPTHQSLRDGQLIQDFFISNYSLGASLSTVFMAILLPLTINNAVTLNRIHFYSDTLLLTKKVFCNTTHVFTRLPTAVLSHRQIWRLIEAIRTMISVGFYL